MESRWVWLDYNEADQKRIRELIVAGADGDTTDPLKLGSAVRDRVADILFPGTSTLHRRLRYAFFLPALLRSRPRVASSGVPQREEDWNKRIRRANDGVVGVFGSRVASTRFFPAYWSSIRAWQFFTAADPRDLTLPKAIESLHAKVDVDEEGNPIGVAPPFRWHPVLVQLVDKLLLNGRLPRDITVHCTPEEASFVLERWSSLPHPRRPALSAVADVVAGGTRLTDAAAFPWELSLPGAENAGVRADLGSAGPVSLICWTLHLAYNLELVRQSRAAESRGVDCVWMKYPGRMDDTVDRIGRQVDWWESALAAESRHLGPWADESTWHDSGMVAPSAPLGTVRDLAATARRLVAGQDDLTKSPWVNAIRKRESLKGLSARLSNPAALAAWTGTPEMADRWDFRWGSTKGILRDIERALIPEEVSTSG